MRAIYRAELRNGLDPPDGLEYVGFWIRLIASLIDSVLAMLVVAPIGALVFDVDILGSGSSNLVLSIAIPAALTVVFWSTRQATPGKMLFGARIVDSDSGAVPRTGQWLLRYLGYFVSMLGFGLGFVWIGIDPRKQGWHDKIARTVVVRPKRREGDPSGTVR